MSLKWKRTNKTETTNERKESDLSGLSNGYKRAWLLLGQANARVKKRQARELSRNQPILCFHVILQHDYPIEQCLLYLRVFLSGKRRGHVWSFHSLADKTNNEYLTKPFSEVIRKSLYQKMSLMLTTDIYCYRWSAHPANPLCYWLSSTGFIRG